MPRTRALPHSRRSQNRHQPSPPEPDEPALAFCVPAGETVVPLVVPGAVAVVVAWGEPASPPLLLPLPPEVGALLGIAGLVNEKFELVQR